MELLKVQVDLKCDWDLEASRVGTGPDVRGTRPVVVTFARSRDRDEVLRKVRRPAKQPLVVPGKAGEEGWGAPGGGREPRHQGEEGPPEEVLQGGGRGGGRLLGAEEPPGEGL